MPKKIHKRAPKKARTVARSQKTKMSAKPAAMATAAPAGSEVPAAAQRFVKDLLIRGEANKRDKRGRLSQQATHAVTKENPDGSVEVERVRFKTF